MSANVKTAVFWVVIICAVVLVYMAVKTGRGPASTNLSVSEFVSDIQAGTIKERQHHRNGRARKCSGRRDR